MLLHCCKQMFLQLHLCRLTTTVVKCMWVLDCIPLSFHKCSSQALMALLMCVCRCQLCWSILAGIHGCTGLMNMVTGGWIAGAAKLLLFLSGFSFLELFNWLQNYSIVLQIQPFFFFCGIISVTIMVAVLICQGFYLNIQQQVQRKVSLEVFSIMCF